MTYSLPKAHQPPRMMDNSLGTYNYTSNFTKKNYTLALVLKSLPICALRIHRLTHASKLKK